MIRVAVAFAAGMLVGALFVFAVEIEPEDAGSTIDNAAVDPIGNLVHHPDVYNEMLHSESDSVASPQEGVDSHTVPPVPSSQIPATYRSIIGPARPPRPTFAERYAVIENEPVDQSWAQAMESGINSHLASVGPDSGTVFEFVQCRSSACIVAGFVIEGGASEVPWLIGEVRNSGWWSGGTSLSMHSNDDHDNAIFVVILPRYPDE